MVATAGDQSGERGLQITGKCSSGSQQALPHAQHTYAQGQVHLQCLTPDMYRVAFIEMHDQFCLSMFVLIKGLHPHTKGCSMAYGIFGVLAGLSRTRDCILTVNIWSCCAVMAQLFSVVSLTRVVSHLRELPALAAPQDLCAARNAGTQHHD